jgi:Cu/Zn superoxide dismutase
VITTRTILMANAVVLIAASLNSANSADMAHAVLKDKQGKDVGHVELTATSEGVRLRVSLKGVPAASGPSISMKSENARDHHSNQRAAT